MLPFFVKSFRTRKVNSIYAFSFSEYRLLNWLRLIIGLRSFLVFQIYPNWMRSVIKTEHESVTVYKYRSTLFVIRRTKLIWSSIFFTKHTKSSRCILCRPDILYVQVKYILVFKAWKETELKKLKNLRNYDVLVLVYYEIGIWII